MSILPIIGLTLDIVGVLLLFFCTSTKKIESEMIYAAAESITSNPKRESSGSRDPYTPKYMGSWNTRVKRNRILQRVSIGLICSGFLLQLLDLVIAELAGA